MHNCNQTQLKTRTMLAIFLLQHTQKLLLLSIIVVVFGACKTKLVIEQKLYNNEPYSIQHYNPHQQKKPLVVILPEPQGTVISVEVIEKLAQRYRIDVIPFLAQDDFVRQMQVDYLRTRRELYSNALNEILVNTGDSLIVIAEGLNANIISQYAHAFKLKKFVAINPYASNLLQVLNHNCLGQTTAQCDSLCNYFGFNNAENVANLIGAFSMLSSDIQYGKRTLNFWKDVLPYNFGYSKKYIKPEIIFTTNTGLQGLCETKNTVVSINNFEEVLLTTMRN